MATQNKFFIVIYKENVKVALKHQNICKAIYRILLYRRIVMREILTINCIESVYANKDVEMNTFLHC